jgi:GDA1/CD39 (nucleoside phosphatase) family
LFLQILDGGSTGSRLHVFEFAASNDNDGATPQQLECVRRGTARARVPLSSFADDYSAIADHLMPAFAKAADMIPAEHHNATRVLYQATAGMRLVPEELQGRMYDALYEQLAGSPRFPFSVRREDVATLSGDEEGFFGAVAANYLEGVIRADLTLDPGAGKPIVGALDMGGSSTQIVFMPAAPDSHVPKETAAVSQPSSCGTCPSGNQSPKLQTDGFFINSYLSYGVDQVREKLWKSWIEQHRRAVAEQQGAAEEVCDSKMIENPCIFRGYSIEYEGYTLVGTGQARVCVERVQQFLADGASANDGRLTGNRSVGGVEHPPVRGKFYAMSNYFYTLDSVRQFVNDLHEHEDAAALVSSWPTPSLHELDKALPLFCDSAWHVIEELHQATPHAYTLPHILPHRCLEAVYMVTLLRDGFGFDPRARDITFALDVQDSEVEWTLGMALVLNSHQPSQADSGESPSASKQVLCDGTCEIRDDDSDVSSSLPQQDEAQNATDPLASRDKVVLSTRLILRRVARFIETISALDYMHTI